MERLYLAGGRNALITMSGYRRLAQPLYLLTISRRRK